MYHVYSNNVQPLHFWNSSLFKEFLKSQYVFSCLLSCWIDGRHIATIKLRVLAKSERNVDDYVVAVGVGLTVLGLLFIGCKVARMQRSRGRYIK